MWRGRNRTMSRKHNPEEIHLTINDIECYDDGLCIRWESDIGFGEYNLTIVDFDYITGYSECMDNNEDKAFLRELLKQASEHILKTIKVKE